MNRYYVLFPFAISFLSSLKPLETVTKTKVVCFRQYWIASSYYFLSQACSSEVSVLAFCLGLVDADNATDFYAKLLSLEGVWNEREMPFLKANQQPAFYTYVNGQVCEMTEILPARCVCTSVRFLCLCPSACLACLHVSRPPCLIAFVYLLLLASL